MECHSLDGSSRRRAGGCGQTHVVWVESVSETLSLFEKGEREGKELC